MFDERREFFAPDTREGDGPPCRRGAPEPVRFRSARALLSRLAGDELATLERAMKSRDLATIRAMLSEYAALATEERRAYAPDTMRPVPMMRPRGWQGGSRWSARERPAPSSAALAP